MTTPAAYVVKQLKRAPDSRRCTFGGLTAYGVLDIRDDTQEDGNGSLVRQRVHVLALPTAAFTALDEGGTVVVYPSRAATGTTVSYTVRDRLLVEDGLVTHYYCVPS